MSVSQVIDMTVLRSLAYHGKFTDTSSYDTRIRTSVLRPFVSQLPTPAATMGLAYPFWGSTEFQLKTTHFIDIYSAN
jgi:hypothetical protein